MEQTLRLLEDESDNTTQYFGRDLLRKHLWSVSIFCHSVLLLVMSKAIMSSGYLFWGRSCVTSFFRVAALTFQCLLHQLRTFNPSPFDRKVSAPYTFLHLRSSGPATVFPSGILLSFEHPLSDWICHTGYPFLSIGPLAWVCFHRFCFIS